MPAPHRSHKHAHTHIHHLSYSHLVFMDAFLFTPHIIKCSSSRCLATTTTSLVCGVRRLLCRLFAANQWLLTARAVFLSLRADVYDVHLFEIDDISGNLNAPPSAAHHIQVSISPSAIWRFAGWAPRAVILMLRWCSLDNLITLMHRWRL